MPKKKKEETKVEEIELEDSSKGISPLNLDLGRDDLNRVVAKLNEVINKVN